MSLNIINYTGVHGDLLREEIKERLGFTFFRQDDDWFTNGPSIVVQNIVDSFDPIPYARKVAKDSIDEALDRLIYGSPSPQQRMELLRASMVLNKQGKGGLSSVEIEREARAVLKETVLSSYVNPADEVRYAIDSATDISLMQSAARLVCDALDSGKSGAELQTIVNGIVW